MPETAETPGPEQVRDRLERLAGRLQARRHGEALQLADGLLAAGVRHPLPLAVSAAALYQAGRFHEAAALLEERARLVDPDPSAWSDLAACLAAAGRPSDALAAWTRAADRAPGDPQLLWSRASALQAVGRVDEARAVLREAARLAPDMFEAHFDLARLALDAGDQAEAAALSAELLARYPGSAAVRWLSARIATNAGELRTALAHLAAALADEGLGPDQRAELLLQQGDGLDRLGEPARAFAAAAQAKALQRAFYAGRAAGRESEVAKLRRLAAWFGAADPAPWRRPSATPPTPVAGPVVGHVFLVGFPRSGTTLLEQALAGHPDVVALEEAPTLAPHAAEFLADAAGLARLAALAPAEADAWRDRYWDEVRAAGADPAGKLFLDKAPAGTLNLPLVARLFPQAKILFARRDPRDVVLSCFRQSFQLNALTYAFTDLAETAACYDAGMALAEVYHTLLPLEQRIVRHEALVADFAGELAGICGFLGLEPTPAMLDVAATAARRTVRTPSAAQVREGLNRRGLGRWRAYAEQLAPVLPVLAPWVEQFGYEP